MNLIQALKRINQLPVHLTLPHYASFGKGGENLVNPLRSGADWMVLRNDHPRYRIPDTRDEWLASLGIDSSKDGQDEWLPARVQSLAQLIEREHIETLYSVGSGGGVFEYYLKRKLPTLRIIVSECTDAGVNRLKRVFLEADGVEQFDALNGEEWKRIASMSRTLVFIYRNEREFTNQQWRHLFDVMHAAGIERVFLGFMWTLTIMALVNRFWNNTKRRLLGERLSFVGYIRTRATLERFWEGRYTLKEEIDFPTCTGLYLTRTS